MNGQRTQKHLTMRLVAALTSTRSCGASETD